MSRIISLKMRSEINHLTRSILELDIESNTSTLGTFFDVPYLRFSLDVRVGF